MSGTSLQGKSVLMFCVEFFGYREQMAEGLKRMGCNVDMYDERPNNSVLLKTMIRYDVGVIHPVLRQYYQQIIRNNREKKYDYIFVVKGEAINREILQLLRNAYPNAKFVLYLWDSVQNIPDCANRMKCYDRVLTFDPVDAHEYGLIFRSLFFGSDFPMGDPEGEYEYDLCFIGTAHSIRPRVIKQMEACCAKADLRFYYYLYSPHILVYLFNRLTNPNYRWIRRSDIHFKPLTRSQMQHIYKQSRCVLDVEHPKQNGITTRPLEMLQMRKKIITTNRQISQFDFYKPENFYWIDQDEPGIDRNFVYTEYVPVEKEILHRYSVEGFLEEVFAEEQPSDLHETQEENNALY